MQEHKQQLINFTAFLDDKRVDIPHLTLHVEGNNLIMHKQSCKINLPITGIATVAKNGLKLILFTKDESRPQPEDNWDDEEEQIQEKAQTNQYKKLDMILFNMLKNVEKGSAFDNILKGDFQIQLQFLQLPFLKQIQTEIEKIISEAQQKKQEPKLCMQAEDEQYQDI